MIRGFDWRDRGKEPPAAAFWEDFASSSGVLFVAHAMNSDGYALYAADEWNTAGTPDHTADADGTVRFQGEPTGATLPQSAMDAAL